MSARASGGIRLRMGVGSVVVMTLAGCSLLTVTPSSRGGVRVPCTQSRAAPFLDAVGAVVSGGGAVGVVVLGRTEYALKGSGSALLVGAIVLGVVDAVSSVHGYRTTAECARVSGLSDEQLAQETLETDVTTIFARAKTAARSGQCVDAVKLEVRIREQDRGYFDAVVRQDPDIALCPVAH